MVIPTSTRPFTVRDTQPQLWKEQQLTAISAVVFYLSK